MVMFTVSLLLLGLTALHGGNSLPNPLHASCKIDWKFGIPCSVVSSRVIKQIKNWSGTQCGSGEKCRYTFISFDNVTLKAKHTTPVKHYVDDLNFVFKPSSAKCSVHGASSSETWYAVLDYGTNYCNLHNLITGSGLNATKNYKETTDDFRCTQYTSSNCEKY